MVVPPSASMPASLKVPTRCSATLSLVVTTAQSGPRTIHRSLGRDPSGHGTSSFDSGCWLEKRARTSSCADAGNTWIRVAMSPPVLQSKLSKNGHRRFAASSTAILSAQSISVARSWAVEPLEARADTGDETDEADVLVLPPESSVEH